MSDSLGPEALLGALPVVPIEIDPGTGRAVHVGPQAEAHLGLPLQAWHDPAFWVTRVLPDDQATLAEVRARTVAEGGRHTLDFRMEHADGRIVWTSEMLRVVDCPERGRRLVGCLWDSTDRKRQEVAIWRSEERLRAVIRRAPDALVLTDPSGIILDMNDQAEALFGYQRADVVGSSIDHLLPARVRDRLPVLREAFDRDPDRRSLVDGHGFAIERSDGVEVPAELGMSVVYDLDETPQILCSVRDLTARRRIEAQLRSSEQRFREMANVLPAMVCLVDRDNRFRFANEAYARWHGWEPRQLEGREVREVLGERLYDSIRLHMEATLRGEAVQVRAQVADPEGHLVPLDLNLVPQFDDTGVVSGYFVVLFDASAEVAAREAERGHREELARVSRVATLGELTASIAHELNQPLSAIVANARAAQRLLESPTGVHQDAQEALGDIAADARRAGQVIASMRELLRRGVSQRQSLSLTDTLRSTVDLLRTEAIARGVSLRLDLSPGTACTVLGDAIQLKQVFMNVILNAIEASARGAHGGPAGAVVVALSEDEEGCRVSVRDNGPGLPTENPEELFAPFVTHRPEGLGMGLAITRTIVEAHGGHVTGATAPNGGAVFTVRLPVTMTVDR